MAEFNKRVDTVEDRMTSLEDKYLKINEEGKNSQISETIALLKAEINDREQGTLLNDVQISGVPEQKGENVVHLTQAISRKLGMTLDPRDIVSAERVGFHHQLSPNEDRRPRLVVVRLARRSLRDDLIKSARVRRGIDTSGIIDGNPSRIYINEHLTRANRLLFYKAREEGKRHGWRYIWSRDGRIFMRRETDAAVQRPLMKLGCVLEKMAEPLVSQVIDYVIYRDLRRYDQGVVVLAFI
ncbi:uncharacterized protein LOC124538279 [Vanessa cardui]|uniref:uncharacterized protein LOC124538279 n=1 Tax=Vanessa cardui TaxID=171605 RepID=UPI001F14277C|nr:uncharacterized protein LOC124538279 [Vanessa cardui]